MQSHSWYYSVQPLGLPVEYKTKEIAWAYSAHSLRARVYQLDVGPAPKGEIHDIEMVQRRAARFVFRDYRREVIIVWILFSKLIGQLYKNVGKLRYSHYYKKLSTNSL